MKKITIFKNQKPKFDVNQKNKSNINPFEINHYQLNYQGTNFNKKRNSKNITKIDKLPKKNKDLKITLQSDNENNIDKLKINKNVKITLYPTKIKPQNCCPYSRIKYFYSDNLKFKDEEN